MKKRQMVLFSSLALACAASAQARPVGDRVGNGGIAIVCRDAITKKIVSAELLDLVEKEIRDQEILRPAKGSLDDELKATADRIGAHQPKVAQYFLEDARNLRITAIAGGFSLPDPRDFHPRIQKKGCGYEVIGLYNDEWDVLEVDEEVYAEIKKSPMHHSAFLAHEVFYRQKRKRGTPDSDSTRELVGILYSSEPFGRDRLAMRVFKFGLDVMKKNADRSTDWADGLEAACVAEYRGTTLRFHESLGEVVLKHADLGGTIAFRIWKSDDDMAVLTRGTGAHASMDLWGPGMKAPVTRDWPAQGQGASVIYVTPGGPVHVHCSFIWR